MVSNTPKRVISAFVMILILVIFLLIGKEAVQVLVLLIGIIACDELFCNFFRKNRKSINYLIMQLMLIVPYIYLNFIDKAYAINDMMLNAALALNIGLLYYLFFRKMSDQLLVKLGKTVPYLIGIVIILPILTMSFYFSFLKWSELLIVLLVINFSMDSGAWFFGKMLGRNKLWPEISPNKTIEGLVGGIFSAGVMGSLVWWFYFGKIHPWLTLSFMLLGLLSQLGDLIQSKLKRQFKLKDSSNLIPGHGGVYDRIDSLIFVVPFFAIAIKYYYFN